MKKFINSISDTPKSIFLAVLTGLLNVVFVLVSGQTRPSFENVYISGISFAFSLLTFAIHIAFCLFCRFSKKTIILRGVFIYQMAGAVSYILFFAGFIAGQGADNGLTAFFAIFEWWTLGYRNLFEMLSRFTGIPFKFTGGVLYLIMTYITASAFLAAKKDIRYENEKRLDAEAVSQKR